MLCLFFPPVPLFDHVLVLQSQVGGQRSGIVCRIPSDWLGFQNQRKKERKVLQKAVNSCLGTMLCLLFSLSLFHVEAGTTPCLLIPPCVSFVSRHIYTYMSLHIDLLISAVCDSVYCRWVCIFWTSSLAPWHRDKPPTLRLFVSSVSLTLFLSFSSSLFVSGRDQCVDTWK